MSLNTNIFTSFQNYSTFTFSKNNKRISIDIKDEPKNLHYNKINYSFESNDEEAYINFVKYFLNFTVQYLRKVYNFKSPIYVSFLTKDNGSFNVIYNDSGYYILEIPRLSKFLDELHTNSSNIDASNLPINSNILLFNLFTAICHELGHVYYEDPKYFKVVIFNDEKSYIHTLKEIRADFFARDLMLELKPLLKIEPRFSWTANKTKSLIALGLTNKNRTVTPKKDGYLVGKTRREFMKIYPCYNETVVNHIFRDYYARTGKDIEEMRMDIQKLPTTANQASYFNNLLCGHLFN